MLEHLSKGARAEYNKAKCDSIVNALFEECWRRHLTAGFTAEDEALFRQLIALDIVSRREPERQRTAEESELIDHFQKSAARFSGTPSFGRVSTLATTLVTVLYDLPDIELPAKSPNEAAVRAVQSLKTP